MELTLGVIAVCIVAKVVCLVMCRDGGVKCGQVVSREAKGCVNYKVFF